MTSDTPISEFFTAGGTLPQDAPSYVMRPTDDELYRNIKAGEFCYVLTPRQMGKSSLMIRTARRLMDEGVRSAVVDLTQTGRVESEDQWYKGILSQIQRRLRLKLDPVKWWEQKADIPNIQKFIEFFEMALTEIREYVVIFMDEIDTTLELDFRDNFFAGIRALYNARAENPDLKRITFVLLGVASPSDLIKDRSRTPFNVGQEIPLKPFKRKDARMLEQGLDAAYPGLGARILNRIFYWTGGHPYLTQKICQSVVDDPLRDYSDEGIDRLVERLFISEEASRETNLQFVRDSVLNPPDRGPNLALYKKILQGREVRDNRNSVSQSHLKLAGLVRVENGRLVVSNNIYARVFDLTWVKRNSEVNWFLRSSIVLSIIVVLLLSGFAYNTIYLPNQFNQASEDLTNANYKSVQALARMFRMKPALSPNEYEYKAKDQFFNSLTRQDQLNLIVINAYGEGKPLNDPHFREDYETVVRGLYTSLADVDGFGQNTDLLDKMKTSLEVLQMQDDPLYKEIYSWLEARAYVEVQDWSGAALSFSAAIQQNPSNPATQFERARVLAMDPSTYAGALKDYDAVLGIVPVSDIEPTAGPSPTATLGAVETSSLNTPAGVPTSLTSVPQSTEAAMISTLAADMAAVLTQPALGPSTLPFQSRFMTRGQRIAAVKNDLLQNAALYAFYVESKADSYPNLADRIPQQTETPAPTGANPRQTQSATSNNAYVAGGTIFHTVVEGEWLEQIARCYGTDLSTVQSANPRITDPQADLAVSSTVIVPDIGSVGTIFGPPCVQFYEVADGDSWRSIAEKFNADVNVLIAANPGVTPIPGTRVRIPLNSKSSTAVTEQAIPFIFPPGNPSSVTELGTISTGSNVRYRFSASAGQTLTVELQVPTNGVNLGIFGPNDTDMKPQVAAPSWTGTLTETGEYTIELNNAAGTTDESYFLTVTILTPEAASTGVPAVQPSDTPASGLKAIESTIFPTVTPVTRIPPTSFPTNTPPVKFQSTAFPTTTSQASIQSSGGSVLPIYYVDTAYTGMEAGTQELPYNTIAEAIAVAQAQPSGGWIYRKENGTWNFYAFVPSTTPAQTGPGN
jgi:hypothetical protein